MTIAQQLNITKFPFEIRDEKGRVIYHEERDGWWFKREYDQNGNEIYLENRYGFIRDNRPKPEPKPEKKQTAVEWMVEQVELISNNKTLSKKDSVKLYDEVIQQTKEIFEEQIMDAYMKAKLEHIDTLGINAQKNKIIKDTEQYFQETYGGDK